MNTARHTAQTTRDQIIRGASAPLGWTLVASSGILVVAGTLAQTLALVTLAGAARLSHGHRQADPNIRPHRDFTSAPVPA
jgi:hypothetical protein